MLSRRVRSVISTGLSSGLSSGLSCQLVLCRGEELSTAATSSSWGIASVGKKIGRSDNRHKKLWRDLLADPSNWWDNRSGKPNVKVPDFKHKHSGEGLWLNDKPTPVWVTSEIAEITCDSHEHQWRDLFSNPSQWWDHRSRKGNPKSPDFINKRTGEALWIENRRTPPWVASDIPSLGPRKLELHTISSVQRLSQFNKSRNYSKTLELFEQMQQEGITPDHYIFLHVLNACAGLAALQQGRRIHKQIIESGCELNTYVGSSLIDMYSKCGSLEDARKVFDRMPTRNVVSWNAMLLGCVKCGQGPEALELFQRMEFERIKPDSFTFVALLNACASTSALEEGRNIHKKILQSSYATDGFVCSSLVDLYAKCGSLEDAQIVFDNMATHDVVSWTALILGYAKSGKVPEALELFHQMQQEGIQPNSITFVVLLNACASMAALEEGRHVHKLIIESGCESDQFIANGLVDMYAKCGSLKDAQSLFDRMSKRDVVSWNSMILGLTKCGQGTEAFELFQKMQLEGIEPTFVTFVVLLNACASMGALEEGRRIHNHLVQSGCEFNTYVGNSVLDMYAKCGSVEDAQILFDKMTKVDVVSWNSLMLGYAKCGKGIEVLELFRQMQQGGIEPDSATFVVVLNACASTAALEEGRHAHKQVVQTGCDSDLYVCNSLVDMYSKCGSIEDAKNVFDRMPTRNVVSWNAMIMGFAIHGLGKEAVTLFEQMSLSGSEMNEITFICLLSACSHGGLVKEAVHYFGCMESIYGVSPIQEHYNCMVDILSRAGYLDHAEAIIKKMPSEPSAATWRSILAGCRSHGDLEMAKRAAKHN